MKEFQLRVNGYELMVEWIPFDRLSDIREISESIYSATWLDGIKRADDFRKAREPYSIVALKILNNPSKEFGNYMKCKLGGIKLGIYGLTQTTVTKEYLMVFQYANYGNLQKFLKHNFSDLTWETKLKILLDVSKDLYEIHKAGIIHTNLHSANILQDQQSYISGLRLSKKNDDDVSESGGVYGDLPYVAPEVLSGQRSSQAADIYSFGVIMYEVSIGQRPFENYQFDVDFAIKICNGLRPEFASGTPSCYIELAKQCMDSDPQKRPTAFDLYSMLNEWKKCMEDSDNTVENKIKKQFLDADKR
ncbi:kinase-like domain-containing protein [Gigaspora rosea]|uniref:Kinase-like domain-containing protein n=1 Tax=Gigaspora rosea TaxID=44941 RepID=A0A397VKS3_9GLOM|nr:kinase-like domain-containing protein [Gigaspora rosea]